MIIRRATEQDLPEMIRLGSIMHQESVYSDLDYDPGKLLANGRDWLKFPDLYFLAVAEDNSGQVIGMYAGFVSEYYFGRDLCAYDLLLFVDPSRRGSMAAVMLVKAFEDWAWSVGAKEVCPGTTTMVAPERTSRLFQALGYTVVGSIFKKGKSYVR